MNKPKMTRQELERLVEKAPKTLHVYLVGIRGYYKRTMGNPVKNDRGIWDDAIFLVTPDSFEAFNANTDPSRYGKNSSGNGIASLLPGTYLYRPGYHHINDLKNRYMALIQADKVKVSRDGSNKVFEGYFGINIHRGGKNSTSSEGCQTIYQPQWDDFYKKVTEALYKWHQDTISYTLIDGN